MRGLSLSFLVLLSIAIPCPHSACAQNAEAPIASTEISADLGSCSALIRVIGADAKPVYGAKITTRIQYGLLGVKRLDLEAFAGADGQVKITHLPETLKKPMFIHIVKDDKDEMVEFKPAASCHATFDVKLQ